VFAAGEMVELGCQTGCLVCWEGTLAPPSLGRRLRSCMPRHACHQRMRRMPKVRHSIIHTSAVRTNTLKLAHTMT
jgi:hypothetical protein